MSRTIENCSLIKQCVSEGIGYPARFFDTNLCEGYQKSDIDDEPCEVCKGCEHCISNLEEYK